MKRFLLAAIIAAGFAMPASAHHGSGTPPTPAAVPAALPVLNLSAEVSAQTYHNGQTREVTLSWTWRNLPYNETFTNSRYVFYRLDTATNVIRESVGSSQWQRGGGSSSSRLTRKIKLRIGSHRIGSITIQRFTPPEHPNHSFYTPQHYHAVGSPIPPGRAYSTITVVVPPAGTTPPPPTPPPTTPPDTATDDTPNDGTHASLRQHQPFTLLRQHHPYALRLDWRTRTHAPLRSGRAHARRLDWRNAARASFRQHRARAPLRRHRARTRRCSRPCAPSSTRRLPLGTPLQHVPRRRQPRTWSASHHSPEERRPRPDRSVRPRRRNRTDRAGPRARP